MIQIVRALFRALQTLPEKDREEAVVPFLAELSALHKLPQTPAFLRIVDQIGKEMFGPREISLVSAHRVPVTLKDALMQTLPHAEVHAVIDPRLIGGAVLRTGDHVFDGSIAGMLERMKKHLVRSS